MADEEERALKILDPDKLSKAQQDNPFVRISDAVYNILEEAILSSALKPGSKLKVNKIADALHVSGTPVREAVEMLTAKGLVLEAVGAGGKYKNYFVFDIDDQDIAELFVARRAIESTAAYICAQKNWYVDMDMLEKNMSDFRKGIHDYISGDSIMIATEHDRRFHTAIVDSSRNRYLKDMYSALDKKLNYMSIRTCEFMAATQNRDDLMMLCSQHESIVFAIRHGYPQLARQAMDDHIDFCADNCLNNRYFSESVK